MSDLPLTAIQPERLAELRSRAASRLAGPASTKGAPARAADALSVLHTLASSPQTASDALTLLHELQVYQVELDMQAQELQESRAELEDALRRQGELYHHQPVGCFTIDAQLRLQELNETGAEMLGVDRDEAFALPLDIYFSAEGARRFRSALAGLDAGARRRALPLSLFPDAGPERSVLASIGADPAAAHRYLVNFTDLGAAQAHPPELS